jgi:peroxin-5
MKGCPSSILTSSVSFPPYFFPFSLYSLSVEESNKYLDPSSSTQSPLALARQMLEQNESLSEVALLLEAAIQKDELGEDGYEAWILLGETRNMDEREEAGMKALTEGVRLAEEAGAAGAGMLVCYPLCPPL